MLEVVFLRSSGDWPSVDEWKQALPAWFVDSCVDDRELKDCVLDQWSLRAWVYWFQPDQRAWRWWDAEPLDSKLRVHLLVRERPYLRGALEWLLRVASA